MAVVRFNSRENRHHLAAQSARFPRIGSRCSQVRVLALQAVYSMMSQHLLLVQRAGYLPRHFPGGGGGTLRPRTAVPALLQQRLALLARVCS